MKNELIQKAINILNDLPNQRTEFGSTYELVSELEKLKSASPLRIVVAFGEELSRIIHENEPAKKAGTNGGCFNVFEFDSKLQLDSFVVGLEAAHGWNDFLVLDMDQERKYSEYIHD